MTRLHYIYRNPARRSFGLIVVGLSALATLSAACSAPAARYHQRAGVQRVPAKTPLSSPDRSSIFPHATLRTERISNGRVTVLVAPSVGRVIGFGPADGADLLWRLPDPPEPADAQTHYVNWGGDKVWPTVQMIWPRLASDGLWPPPFRSERPGWSLKERAEYRIVLESPVDPTLGTRTHREIALAQNASRLTIRNRIVRVHANPYPVTVWSVTQVRMPRYTLLGLADERPLPERPWIWLAASNDSATQWIDRLGQAVRFDPPGKPSTKLGTLGPWVAGVYDQHVLVQHHRFDPSGAYPDGSSVQVYADERYAELETLSACRYLQPGETLEHTVIWRLLDRGQQEPDDIVKRIAALTTAE